MKITFYFCIKYKNMRKISFLMAFIIFNVACKKNTTPAPTPTPMASNFSYKVDAGNTVAVDSARATLYTLGIAPFHRMIDVYAFKGGLQVMEFHFKPSTGSVTADCTFNNAWLTYLTGINYPTDYYHSTSGSLNVTLCDTIAKKIEGNFNFTGSNGTSVKLITEGVMKVDITTVQ